MILRRWTRHDGLELVHSVHFGMQVAAERWFEDTISSSRDDLVALVDNDCPDPEVPRTGRLEGFTRCCCDELIVGQVERSGVQLSR